MHLAFARQCAARGKEREGGRERKRVRERAGRWEEKEKEGASTDIARRGIALERSRAKCRGRIPERRPPSPRECVSEPANAQLT